MDNVGHAGHLLYAARSKLDNVGAIKSQLCIVNNSKRLERIVERLETVASVGEVQLRQSRKRDQAAAKEIEKLGPLLHSAIELYTSGKHGRALTKPKIRDILLFTFEATPTRMQGKRMNGSSS